MDAKSTRMIKLSEVQYAPKHYKDALITVDGIGYVGVFTSVGITMVGDVAQAQGVPAKPTNLQLADAADASGNVIAVPTMESSPDHLVLEWSDDGRKLKVNLARLLTLKQVEILSETRMLIELERVDDPDFGASILVKTQSAAFVPKKKGAPRKKKTTSGTQAATAAQPNQSAQQAQQPAKS